MTMILSFQCVLLIIILDLCYLLQIWRSEDSMMQVHLSWYCKTDTSRTL